MTEPFPRRLRRKSRALALPLAVLSVAAMLHAPAAAQQRFDARGGDYIAAVVNQELVTAGEVQRRVEGALAEARRRGARLPPEAELRRQVLDALIDERVIITNARESGLRVEEAEIDRAVQNIAAQNQISMEVLRQRLAAEGMDYARFRATLRDQIMIERMREREVYRRIQISDEEVDKILDEERARINAAAETNLAQILVTVPERADEATVAARRERVMAALARVRGGEAFDAVAREVSEDGNRARGGEIGLLPAARLPDVFIEATRLLRPGEVTAQPLRSGAGFHILKVVERKEIPLGEATETRARHVLLRTSPQLSAEVASRRLADYRRQIETGARSFEDIARQYSEDGSAASGGELGWAGPGVMVPEFEAAMNALPVGGLSAPVVSRFGVHLIQVLERRKVVLDVKQLREQARNALREQRFEQVYLDWTKELRSRAYIEFREPPQ
ncbi:MAG: peptidylprolyl isomerase [Rubrivivax sp.]|jgi:peptidyl-prolyl cis-trans isomerase SurA|nr:peptidylprolyl isomerase [Betaproteobacteria bacterium]MBP6318407.1 peptidylprolyl isomerase [Rubrivivax sp.]MBK7275744.1 peptidylprolyl isomerase [Betaproteobacteria bacterium]MBK7460669.1 peptidylprolyl isomerase [Betaproteobacteria bacterium]MBK7516917.1 peptidylprolyl isomerase [Betaproteobacteria bacterium]